MIAILGSLGTLSAQLRVQYPQEGRIDLGKGHRTKEERQARREDRLKARQQDLDLTVEGQGVPSLSNAAKRRQKQLGRMREEFVGKLSRAFPDIPVSRVKDYVTTVMNSDVSGFKEYSPDFKLDSLDFHIDSLSFSRNSLEDFALPYYPEDSLKRDELSELCQELEQDLQPRAQALLGKEGVMNELSAFDQPELEGAMGPKAPDALLENDEQLAAAMQNLEQYRGQFLEVDGLRNSSKIASKQFLIPHYQSPFEGKEEVLDKAQQLVKVEKHKPSFKGMIKSFLDQHEEAVAEKKLLQRFELGGYVQYFFGRPSFLDVAPTIGYQLTGKATLGIGGNYRWTIGKGDPGASLPMPRQNVGYRGYFNYDLIGSIFINNEFERLYVPKDKTEPKQYQWVNGYLLGIGNEVKVRQKVTMTVLLQYNVLYSVKTPYPKPWVLKVGFKI